MGAFFFNQLQTRLINPMNLMVSRDGTSNDGYFVQDEILMKVPELLQTLAAVYAGLLAVGGIMLLQHAPASRQCRLGVEQMCERVVIVAAGPMGERG